MEKKRKDVLIVVVCLLLVLAINVIFPNRSYLRPDTTPLSKLLNTVLTFIVLSGALHLLRKGKR